MLVWAGQAGQMSVGGSFAPDSIADIALWLDANADLTITKDGSDLVSNWESRHSASTNFVQATATNQPLWEDDVYKGFPGVKFNGLDNFMTSTGLNMPDANGLTLVFVMAKSFSSSASRGLFTGGTTNTIGMIYSNGGNGGARTFGTTGSLLASNNLNSAIDAIMHTAESGSQALYTGGNFDTAKATATDALAFSFDGTQHLGSNATGTAEFMDGYALEVIAYSRALSATERASLQSYVKNKYIVDDIFADVSKLVYATKAFSVNSEDGTPAGLTFSSDGTKAYVVGFSTGAVYQYTLSTAWDASTGTYASKSLDTTSEDIAPFSVEFAPDGDICYVTGNTSDAVYQYTLSTAWDISTASYASKSMDISSEAPTPVGISLSSDGTKAYVIGTTANKIFQYTLSTAWDISTGSYSGKSLTTTSQATSPAGLDFSPNGDIVFIGDFASDAVYQYTLSTAWDISTASYGGGTGSVSTQETDIRGLSIKPDGTTLFICGLATDNVRQYTL